MDKYISHSSWRREAWKGHSDEKNVRAAIRYARANWRTELRIFARDGGSSDQSLYVEISPAAWDTAFFAN